MPIIPTPIEPGAEVKLDRWRIFELRLPAADGPSRHLVGRVGPDAGAPPDRVTSPVTGFDWMLDLAWTRSGRIYTLMKPGYIDTQTQVFAEWLRAHGIAPETVRDVTHAVLAERADALNKRLAKQGGKAPEMVEIPRRRSE
jgi:hypothetical protein